MKLRLFVLCSALPLSFIACSGIGTIGEREYPVTVRGSHFEKNGAPYYVAGTNLWYGAYLGVTDTTGNHERLGRELDRLAALGITNLRVLAGSESSAVGRCISPAFQRRPGEVNEELLRGLDRLLAEMAARRMHAVLYLTNYWEWSGGMAQYAVWANGGGGVDPAAPDQGGWPAYMNFAASFYENRAANDIYREYIRRLVTRKNTVNGRLYAGDPTIMAWQLANEPRPGTVGPEGEKNLPAFIRWIDETAAFIHGLDSVHLVSSGSEGTTGCLLSDDNFLRAHASPHIDYLTFHLWPSIWTWYDPLRSGETLPAAIDSSLVYIARHVELARRLGKPIILEEFGMGRDGDVMQPGTATRARDEFFGAVLAAVCDSARAGAPLAGSNFWGWGGEGRARQADWLWRPGDPYTGDPPQEPQGWNSIFNADSTTLRLIQHHARLMRDLSTLQHRDPAE